MDAFIGIGLPGASRLRGSWVVGTVLPFMLSLEVKYVFRLSPFINSPFLQIDPLFLGRSLEVYASLGGSGGLIRRRSDTPEVFGLSDNLMNQTIGLLSRTLHFLKLPLH
jgi:hypothetical protein